jgi:fatty-acid desaturase
LSEVISITNRTKPNWVTIIALVFLHAGAVAAPFFFTWKAFWVAVALHYFSVGWGISLGYHRLHTHRGYKCPLWFEYMLAVWGAMTLEGGPIFWVATHRIHHQKSDQPGDPHSPRDGAWWAHIGWIILGEAKHNNTRLMAKYAPDLAKHKFYVWLNNWHWVPLTVTGILLALWGGWSMVLWAICFRVIFGLHATWAVNSATHMWGSRRFRTRDDSRNNWWVALLTFGEGWHNNHHAHPVSARHGLTWYEFDPTWLTLKFMRAIGFVRNIQVAKVNSVLDEERIVA